MLQLILFDCYLYYSDLTIHHRLSDDSNIIGSLNYHKLDGYRKHAGFENKSAFVKFTHQKNEILHKLSILHFDSPYAFDSGGLTLEEVNRDRSQGRERNIIFNTTRKYSISRSTKALKHHSNSQMT